MRMELLPNPSQLFILSFYTGALLSAYKALLYWLGRKRAAWAMLFFCLGRRGWMAFFLLGRFSSEDKNPTVRFKMVFSSKSSRRVRC